MPSQANELRILPDYYEPLHELARDNHLNVNTLANEIIGLYLEKKHPAWRKPEKRRRFERKKAIIPAMIYEKDAPGSEGQYYPVAILDISQGGVRLSLPSEVATTIKQSSCIEIIFSVNEDSAPLVFRCTSTRVENRASQIQVGAMFTDTDPDSRKTLKEFLCDNDFSIENDTGR